MLESEAHTNFSNVLVWGMQEGQNFSPSPKKCSDYYPFGLTMPTRNGRTGSLSEIADSYKFTGHERDDEPAGLTLDYMMARNYDPIIGRFLQIDPYAVKYPSLSPYAYVANNPLLLIDPTGKEIEICSGTGDDKTCAMYESGTEYKGDNEFIKKAFEAIDFIKNNSETGNELYSLLESDESIIQIYELSEADARNDKTEFDPNSNTIWWNAETAFNDDGADGSPATALSHEAGHALWWNYSEETKNQTRMDRISNPDNSSMSNAHEEKVINLIENPIRVEVGEQPRDCHRCKKVIKTKVNSPTKKKN